MTYVIEVARCINCGWCRGECPTKAVQASFAGRVTYAIEVDWCIDCDLCAQVCPMNCISHDPSAQPGPDQLQLARQRARDLDRAPATRSWNRRPPWMRPPRNHGDTASK